MEVRDFSFTYLIVSLTVLILCVFLAFFRNKLYIRICAIAFTCFVVSEALISGQPNGDFLLTVSIPYILYFLGNLLFYCGIRIYCNASSIWLKRFWIYLAADILANIYLTLIVYNLLIRVIIIACINCLLYIDFFVFLKRERDKLTSITLFNLFGVIGINIASYIMITILISLNYAVNDLMVYNYGINSFILIVQIVISFIWFGTIILLNDYEMLQEVKISEDKYRLITENTNDLIWVYNLKNNQIKYVSPSVIKITGYTEEEFMLLKPDNIIDPELFIEIKKTLLDSNEGIFDNSKSHATHVKELQHALKNGEKRWIEVSMNIKHNSLGELEVYGVSRDIEERKKTEAFIKNLSYRDQLTGLYNRHYLQERVGGEIHRSDRYHDPISMVTFDIDFFKKINDKFGHPAGDEVLKELARLVKGMIRESDMLFRTGGEEFMLVMPETAGKDAEKKAEAIRISIEQLDNQKTGHFTCSFGVAEKLTNEEFERWFIRADGALYQAKRSGRNKVVNASDINFEMQTAAADS